MSLQNPAVVGHHDCIAPSLLPGLHLLMSPPARCSLIPDSQETDPYVRIGNAVVCLCCIASQAFESSQNFAQTQTNIAELR